MPSAICIGSKNNVSQVNGQAILAILSIINIYFLWLRKIKQKHFFPFHSKSEQSNLHIWKSYLANSHYWTEAAYYCSAKPILHFSQ